MLLVKIGGKYVHLLKMFGAMFTLGCAFNVLFSAFQLSQEMDTLYASVNTIKSVSMGDAFGRITGPIASLFLWLAFMVIGLALYRSDRTILPLEEDIEEAAELRLPRVPATPRAPRKGKK
jgi:hypothetical protein